MVQNALILVLVHIVVKESRTVSVYHLQSVRNALGHSQREHTFNKVSEK